jgi:hypothetical protein
MRNSGCFGYAELSVQEALWAGSRKQGVKLSEEKQRRTSYKPSWSLFCYQLTKETHK